MGCVLRQASASCVVGSKALLHRCTARASCEAFVSAGERKARGAAERDVRGQGREHAAAALDARAVTPTEGVRCETAVRPCGHSADVHYQDRRHGWSTTCHDDALLSVCGMETRLVHTTVPRSCLMCERHGCATVIVRQICIHAETNCIVDESCQANVTGKLARTCA